MQKTSLFQSHNALGAKMISFGGWEMPRDYGDGTRSEVLACRSNAGMFDVSHMGEFRVRGGEALAFIQHITTNDAARLTPGMSQYSLLLNESGGVKDDVLVYCDAPEDYWVVVNAGCKEKDWEWFSHNVRAFKTRLTDESGATALIAVQGPQAVAKVNSLAEGLLPKIKRFRFETAMICELACTISRTGYTGEDGYELFCCWEDAPALWSALLETGAVPCGLAARDVLRIEAGYPLYGHELVETESPIGCNVGWAIKTSKLDFIGRDDVVKRSQDGIRQRLVGLGATTPNAIPREGQLVFGSVSDEPVGRVTSGTLSPSIGKGIALAQVGAGVSEAGTQLFVDIRGRKAEVEVTALPFYRGLDSK
jgi:aminomethyltransferase